MYDDINIRDKFINIIVDGFRLGQVRHFKYFNQNIIKIIQFCMDKDQ